MRTGVGLQRRVVASRYPDLVLPAVAAGMVSIYVPGGDAQYGSAALPAIRRFPVNIRLQAFGEAIAIRAINWSLYAGPVPVNDTGAPYVVPTLLLAPLVIVEPGEREDYGAWGFGGISFQAANPGVNVLYETMLSGFNGTLHFPAPGINTRAGGLIIEAGSSTRVLVGPPLGAYPIDASNIWTGQTVPQGGASVDVTFDVIPEVLGRFDRER